MKKTLFQLLILFCTQAVTAQQITLGGTYGQVHYYGQDDYRNTDLKAKGLALGFEGRFPKQIGKHLVWGLGANMQELGSLGKVAVHIGPLPHSDVPYLVLHKQLNICPSFRWYFKEAFSGFYLGLSGVLSRTFINTTGYPTSDNYLQLEALSNPTDHRYLAIGAFLGFEVKIKDRLRANVFGSIYDGKEWALAHRQPKTKGEVVPLPEKPIHLFKFFP